jgi:PilZ domain
MLERREETRRATNIRGVARYGANGHEQPCTVIDLSENGAGLSFGSVFGIPSTFLLCIDGDNRTRHCRVIWANGKRLGVRFE